MQAENLILTEGTMQIVADGVVSRFSSDSRMTPEDFAKVFGGIFDKVVEDIEADDGFDPVAVTISFTILPKDTDDSGHEVDLPF